MILYIKIVNYHTVGPTLEIAFKANIIRPPACMEVQGNTTLLWCQAESLAEPMA